MKYEKILGTENPADLMTKILGKGDIEERITGMGMRIVA